MARCSKCEMRRHLHNTTDDFQKMRKNGQLRTTNRHSDMEEEETSITTGQEMRLLLPEIWLEVMGYLSVGDLCNLTLTSTAFHSLASTPKLWRNAHIKKIKFKNGFIEDFFKVQKFRKVKKLSFSRLQLSEENTRAFFKNFQFFDNLEELDLQGVNLSKVPPEVLSDCGQHLQKLDLTFTKLTPWQSQHLFERLEQNHSAKLKIASFKAANLSQVNAQTLATVLVRLELVNLSFTELTKEQLTVLFVRIVNRKNVNLKSLEFFSVDLSPVSPRLLGKTVSWLEVANLSNTELRFEHIHSIVNEVLESKVIREINLDFSEVFNVNDDIFAKSLSKLEKVSLAWSVMDMAQLESLFTLIAKEAKMKELDLLDTDLTSLSPELLGKAVNNLEKINLSGSKLHGEQLNQMFQEFDFKILKDLNMDYLDLSAVLPESLAMVLINLKKISLKKCNLTTAQINLIFESIAKNTREDVKLKNANLYGNNFKEVEAEHLSNSASKLAYLDISNTNISHAVTSSLLTHLSEIGDNSHLRHLVLAGIPLTHVQASLVTSAMARLEKLDLSNCSLSWEQLEVILDAVRPPAPLRQLSLFNVDLENVNKEVLARANSHAFINHRYHI